MINSIKCITNKTGNMGLLNKTAFLGILLLMVIGAGIGQETGQPSDAWNNFIQDVKKLFSRIEKICERTDSQLCGWLKMLDMNIDTLAGLIYENLKNFNSDLPNNLAERLEPALKMLFIFLNDRR